MALLAARVDAAVSSKRAFAWAFPEITAAVASLALRRTPKTRFGAGARGAASDTVVASPEPAATAVLATLDAVCAE